MPGLKQGLLAWNSPWSQGPSIGPLVVISVFKFFIPECFLRCWLQGDNCPKEVRNSFVGKWCSLLTQAQYFKTATHAHLCKGHTHEDIGGGNQLWNFVLIAKLWQCNTFGKSLHSPVRWCFQHCYSSSTCMSWFTDPCRCDEVGQLEFWSHHLPIPVELWKIQSQQSQGAWQKRWLLFWWRLVQSSRLSTSIRLLGCILSSPSSKGWIMCD